MKQEPDVDLVQRCLHGESKAFEILVERYQKPIYNLALRLSTNTEDAADITQTVFVKVYEKLRTFDSKHKFFSWLYKIAVNESLNFLNRKKNYERFDEEVHSREKPQEDSFPDLEVTKKIDNALLELKPDYRIVVVLNHFQDLSYKEIGYILNVHENTVKSRLFSARKKLKSILVKRGVSHA